ncbi:hypothetical protein D3C75_1017720 [compost metagenome]
MGPTVATHQFDDLPIGLLGWRQPQISQHREHFSPGHIAVFQFFIGQIEHVSGLLQLRGTGCNAFLQVVIEQSQLGVLPTCQQLQALALAFGMLVLQGLAQGQ